MLNRAGSNADWQDASSAGIDRRGNDLEAVGIDILKGVHQIWYDEQTRKQVADFFTPVHNPKLTEYYENQVIYNLAVQGKHLESEWFGVLSPVFFAKAAASWGNITPSYIRQKLTDDIDILSFTKSQNKNIITQGNHYHARKKGNFAEIVQRVLAVAGIVWNVRNPLRFPVLMNYVIARGWVWDRYFNEMLQPCMDAMRAATGDLKDLLWQDSEYQRARSQSMRKRLLHEIGVPYAPMHTFVCERLWSVWVEMNYEEVRKRHYRDI